MSELKFFVVILLGAIVVSLGKALFHMSSGPDQSGQTVKALAVRVGLSVTLFLLLMVAWYIGRISPHGIG